MDRTVQPGDVGKPSHHRHPQWRRGERTAEEHVEHLTRKLKAHGSCIAVGVVMAILVTYLPARWANPHVVAMVPAVPSLVQEVLDRLLRI